MNNAEFHRSITFPHKVSASTQTKTTVLEVWRLSKELTSQLVWRHYFLQSCILNKKRMVSKTREKVLSYTLLIPIWLPASPVISVKCVYYQAAEDSTSIDTFAKQKIFSSVGSGRS
jgi:hypothetical protein